MNWGKFDVTIIVVMSVAVVSMSMVFPMIGLTSADANENDIPDLDVQSDRFDFSGDFPDRPGTPSSGTMDFNSSDVQFSDNQLWLDGDTSNGTELVLLQNGSNDNAKINLNDWDAGNLDAQENAYLNGTGDTAVVSNFSYEIRFEVTDYEETNGDLDVTVEYEITDQPQSDGGWLGRIPVVGTLFSQGEALAGVLSWVGSVVWWGFATFFDIVLNLVGMLFDAMTYGFSLADWLVTSYADVISGAGSWAAVFVALPGIILTAELFKILMLGIKLLPTT